MIKTYYIESKDNVIIGYFDNYNETKRNLIKLNSEYSAIMMKGSYFGEGFHQYRLTYNNGKFKREALR